MNEHTRELHALGQTPWPDQISRPLLRSGTLQRYIQEFSITGLPNLFIRIPGTSQGVLSVEESIFGGVPVNVTLLFPNERYLAAAGACMFDLERRLAAGLNLQVVSVALLFVSRWDVAAKEEIAPAFQNRLGIAMARRTYRAQWELLASDRWQRLAKAGARPQCLLWARTGSNDPAAPTPCTFKPWPHSTPSTRCLRKRCWPLQATAASVTRYRADGGYADAVLEKFRREGVDDSALPERLQREGVETVATSWHEMLSRSREKCPTKSASRIG